MGFLNSLFSIRRSYFTFCILHFAFCNLWLSSNGQDAPLGTLKFPWSGGINSCQYGSVDLDLDGINDLLIFDRHGNRILPFINNGTYGLNGYSYHPEYIKYFPDIHDWIVFKDFNRDGKQDIFTYSSGGIRVFMNISDTILKYKLVTNLLESYYYAGKIGILVTLVEYPAIEDIDDDGDLDILTFAALGSYVEYHKNLSMEKYGNCDSLDYQLADPCWGDFQQSSGSNLLILNITCPYKDEPLTQNRCTDPAGSKHIGSSFLLIDMDGNGVKDLVLGDFDFPNLKLLINGGTPDSAHMTSQDTTFPSKTRPVNLFSFPAASYLDINNDGKRDLVVSPFDPALYSSENFQGNWFYENTGADSVPDFQFMTGRLFQNEMIDVGSNSYPVLYDVDGDGHTDLLIGNYGYYDSSYYASGFLHSVFSSRIAWYKNTGSSLNPSFRLENNDFAGISSLKMTGAFPACGDPDGDGDMDLILGSSDGTLVFLKNIAGTGNSPVFDAPVFNYQDIDVGDFSAPQLFDLDGNGSLDLVIGEQKGNLNYFNNTGTPQNPQFSFVTDSLGKVNVTNYNLSYDGFSTPFFFRDSFNSTGLFVGCEEGKIHYFTGIDNNLSGKFVPADSLIGSIINAPIPENSGWRTAVSVAYLSDPSKPDMIIGNFSGGLNYITHQTVPIVISSLMDRPDAKNTAFRIYPNPADDLIHVERINSSFHKDEPLTIYDLPGRVVFESFFKDKITIRTGDWHQGYFIIRIGTTVQKFIVIH